MDKLFDVIIVNYNSTQHTENNIAVLLNSKLKEHVNIIVQDNASKEDVIALKRRFPQISLVLNNKNIGFAAATNKALLMSKTPYVVLINPDAYIEYDFFQAVIQYLKEHPEVGILGPKILDFDGSVQGSARSFPNPLTSLFGRNSYLTKIFPNNAISRANILNTGIEAKRCKEVDWVSGACMVIRKDALRQTGNFDERFFMYWEDADLCRRMWEKGWKVIYFPKVTVHHQVGQSSRTNPYATILYFHKSCFKLFEKYSGWHHAIFYPLVIAALAFRGVCIAGLATIKGVGRK